MRSKSLITNIWEIALENITFLTHLSKNRGRRFLKTYLKENNFRTQLVDIPTLHIIYTFWNTFF